jgi:hypothetical protein
VAPGFDGRVWMMFPSQDVKMQDLTPTSLFSRRSPFKSDNGYIKFDVDS